MKAKRLITLIICLALAPVWAPLAPASAATVEELAKEQILQDRLHFLRTLTETLALDTAATGLSLGDRHLGSAESLKLRDSLVGMLASAMKRHRRELPRFEEMPARLSWYDLLYQTVADISSKINPNMPLESGAAWLLGRVPMLARSTWDMTLELPPEFIALANEGYREHGGFYLGTVAVTYVPYFLITEFLEHAVFHLPPAFGCAQIQFAYFAAVSAFMHPVMALRSRLMTNTETASYRARFRDSIKNVGRYLKDWPEQHAIHKKLGLLSDGAEAQGLLFDRKKLSEKDFASGGEHLIEKLARHPLFWPVIALLLEKDNLEGEDLDAAETVTATLREQIEAILGRDHPAGEADRILDTLLRRMKLRQQVELFRWILKQHTESVKDMWESDKLKFWAEFNNVRGSLGKLRSALSDYDYSMRFMIENPDRINAPEARAREISELVQGKLLKGLRYLDKFYQSDDKTAAARELEAHAYEAAGTFKLLRQGYLFAPCEEAALN